MNFQVINTKISMYVNLGLTQFNAKFTPEKKKKKKTKI